MGFIFVAQRLAKVVGMQRLLPTDLILSTKPLIPPLSFFITHWILSTN